MDDDKERREFIKRVYEPSPTLLLDLHERITVVESASRFAEGQRTEILRELLELRKELREANIMMLARDINAIRENVIQLQTKVAEIDHIVLTAQGGLRAGVGAVRVAWAFIGALGGIAGALLSWWLARKT